MLAVIASVRAGAGVALLDAVVANRSLTGALAAGGAVTGAGLVAIMRHE
jgi:hypothetical protein